MKRNEQQKRWKQKRKSFIPFVWRSECGLKASAATVCNGFRYDIHYISKEWGDLRATFFLRFISFHDGIPFGRFFFFFLISLNSFEIRQCLLCCTGAMYFSVMERSLNSNSYLYFINNNAINFLLMFRMSTDFIGIIWHTAQAHA